MLECQVYTEREDTLLRIITVRHTGLFRINVEFGQFTDSPKVLSFEIDTQTVDADPAHPFLREGVSDLQILQPYIGGILKIAGLRLLIFGEVIN